MDGMPTQKMNKITRNIRTRTAVQKMRTTRGFFGAEDRRGVSDRIYDLEMALRVCQARIRQEAEEIDLLELIPQQ